MSDFSLRDTPALALLRQQPDTLGQFSPDHIAAAQDLLRVSKRLLGAFSEEFALHGLSPGRYAVLMALYVEGGPLSPSELADRVGVTRPTITDLISTLVRDDLIGLEPADPRDRRRKGVVVTAKGRKLLGELVPDIFGQMAALVAPLTRQERNQLVQLLKKVEANLGRTPAPVTAKE